MLDNFEKFYDDLKEQDSDNRLSMRNKNTILLKLENGKEVLFHDNFFETYIEFMNNGKRYATYHPEYENIYNDMIGYMKGTKPLPSVKANSIQFGFILFMLLSSLAVLFVVYLLFDFTKLYLIEKINFIMAVITVTWAVEIAVKCGIKKLIDKKGK